MNSDNNYKNLEDYLPVGEKPTFRKEDLAKIEKYFHEIIIERANTVHDDFEAFCKEQSLVLPSITNSLLDIKKPEYFAVPGFYGGFAYILISEDGRPKLITDSWSRVVGGSGERHEITTNGAKLIVKGFV